MFRLSTNKIGWKNEITIFVLGYYSKLSVNEMI